MIRVVTRGDDAGSSRSANAAIREACEQGVLRNVSLLACGPEIEDAARQLLGLKHVAFGLHVCLNAEWDFPRWGPVVGAKKVPSLVDPDGNFTHTPAMLNERGFVLDEMMLEIAAQLDRLRSLGFPLTYMDEHMGVGWLKGFGERLVEMARREKLIFRPALSDWPKLPQLNESRAENFARRIRSAVPGNYLIVGHPCYNDAETSSIRGAGIQPGQIAVEREGERRMFTESVVTSLVQEKHFTPIRYDQL